jgi:hypothetical protein
MYYIWGEILNARTHYVTIETNSYSSNEVKSQAQDDYGQGQNQVDMIDILFWWRLKAMAFRLNGFQLKWLKLCSHLNLSK